MAAIARKDGSTEGLKVSLRRRWRRLAVDWLGEAPPVVMETHGGLGRLFIGCYEDIAQGIVFEQQPSRVEVLARQRPSWAVYGGDCERLLTVGVGAHLSVDWLDLDPYGSPWEALHAFLTSARPRASHVVLTVNDGLRLRVKIDQSWRTPVLEPVVRRFGNDLHDRYLQVCRWLLEREAGEAGYDLSRFEGYYCGHAAQMTHYAALLTLPASSGSWTGQVGGKSSPSSLTGGVKEPGN